MTAAAAPADERTPADRRRDRHLAAITRGQHPLSVALRTPLRLHPAARRVGDRTPTEHPRVTHGPGTDAARGGPVCGHLHPERAPD